MSINVMTSCVLVLSGLFSGLGPTLLRDAPFSGLYLMFYTQAKKQLRHAHNIDDSAPVVHFGCGLVSGCFASVITQPADVVKTRMQVLQCADKRVRTVVRNIYQVSDPNPHRNALQIS